MAAPETSENFDEALLQDGNAGNDQLASLWPGAVVLQEMPAEPGKLPEKARERSVKLNELAETGFSETEKARWDLPIRRAIVAMSMHGLLELGDAPAKEGVREITVDLNNFREHHSWTALKNDIGPLANAHGKRVPKADVLATFSEAIGPVLSHGDPTPKSLFYIPDGDPLDVNVIKNTQCHLGLWEVCIDFPSGYPLKSGGSAEANEVALAAVVYGTQWGDARRENGQLLVHFPDTAVGSYNPINARFFQRMSFTGRLDGSALDIKHSPRRFLEDCPELTSRGLVKKDDFRAHSGEGGLYSMERVVDMVPQRNGRIMVDGVLYILGNDYQPDRGRFTVTKISPDYACVISHTPRGKGTQIKITDVFSLITPQEKKQREQGISSPFVGKKELASRRWSPDDFVIKEPSAAYLLEGWKSFISFSNDLEEKGMDVVNWPLKEQTMLWELATSKKLGSRIKELIGDSKLTLKDKQDRVKALLILSGNLQDVSKVFQIGKEQNVQFLFENLAQIADLLSNTEEFAQNSDKYSEDQLDNIRHINDMILRYASKLFLSAHDVLRGENPITLQDANNVLSDFRRRVERWQQTEFLRGVTTKDNRYLALLDLYESTPSGTNMQTLILAKIEAYWREDLVAESSGSHNSSILESVDRIRKFYVGNKELFETASQTTGDTPRELESLATFFESFDRIDGFVLDLACGDRKRITEHMARMLKGKAHVYAMDIWSPGPNSQENLTVIQGSIDAIPLRDHSVSIATLNWSPLNDWKERNSQLANFDELGRIMKVGGKVRADVAYLEGGEGSWETLATLQFAEGANSYGDIQVVFPGGRDGEFHIYPLPELKAMFARAGFGQVEVEIWRTQAGKPRVVVTATYSGKENPLPLA